jgi:hypothetical protein
MKHIIPFIILFILSARLFAQGGTDSAAYQEQRKKINTMLAGRAEKFDQYNESLTQHTGIFGLQTKKDIRRSNDILMDIVTTDNDIFKQLKILLQYRIFQQAQVQNHARETEQNIVGFMQTINKLRNQNEQLKIAAVAAQSRQERMKLIFMAVIVLMLAVIVGLVISRKSKALTRKS